MTLGVDRRLRSSSVPSLVEPPAPKVTEKKAGDSSGQLSPGGAQLLLTFGSLGRKELETERALGHYLRSGISFDSSQPMTL